MEGQRAFRIPEGIRETNQISFDEFIDIIYHSKFSGESGYFTKEHV